MAKGKLTVQGKAKARPSPPAKVKARPGSTVKAKAAKRPAAKKAAAKKPIAKGAGKPTQSKKAAPKAAAPKAAPPTAPATTSKAASAKAATKAAAKGPAKGATPPASPSATAKPAKTTTPSKPTGEPNLSVAGQLYQRGKLVPGVLHIDTQTGRIVRIAKSTTLANHVDYGNKAILPGAIDIHVHFREPGHTHKEDITSGSTSAAFGGVTGFVDMPNTLPATISARAVRDKLATMAQKSLVDYGVFAGGSWYTQELPEMLKHAVGVKTYLGASTGDLLLEEMERLRLILAAAADAGRPAVLHAESERVLKQMRRTEHALVDHDMTRPPLAEVEAIYDAMKASAGLKRPARVHIAHIASADAVQAATPTGFSMGVCPHHLLLDHTASLSHAYGKMNPPLRSPAHREALWNLFAAGKIPILESDHAPHTKAEKEDQFHAAPSGVPGVETMAPLLLAQAKAGRVDLGIVVDALSANPAKLLGLTDRGALEPGMRADFAVYDMAHAAKLEPARLHSKCGWSPFAGHSVVMPSHTYLAGHPVVADGELVAAPGNGRPLLG